MEKTNSISAPLHELLVKLRFLSMIEDGKKINFGSLTFSNSGSLIDSMYRNITGENRKNLISHLLRIINQTISAINEYKDTEYCKMIINHLASAKVGIQALIITYQGDPGIIAELETIMANINLQLGKNTCLLEDPP